MASKSIVCSWLAATVLAVLLCLGGTSHACGGFFCSAVAPVNQSAEQIIFSQNADDTVTAVINIQYQGEAERFAWVLPISGVPDVGVSSNLAFQRLLNATTPSYSLTQRVEGTCKEVNYNTFPGAGGTTASGGSFSASGGTGGTQGAGPIVNVVAQGSVGPYDYVAISVSPDANNPAKVALQWLSDNHFDVSALGGDILADYLASGSNLLAFKLTKGNSAGSIRPIRVTYPGKYPVIPIRPTAVAANNDMGVMVYVVADAQAIPKNYKSLVLNEALINWFNFSSSYNQVINRAADEAGGQGFVSELAEQSVNLRQTIWTQVDQQNWEFVHNMDYGFAPPATDGGAPVGNAWPLLNQLISQYNGWDGLQEAVTGAVTLPSDITIQAFLAAPYLYQDDPRIEIDGLKLLDGVQQNVISPMVETQRLILSRPYLTRLFTTMSADEMTVDPTFSTNPDLADISNRHTAEQVIECNPDVYFYQAPWRVTLPQGGTVHGTQGGGWPIDPADPAMPANRKVVTLTESGSGKVDTDNTQAIWDALEVLNVIPNPAMSTNPSGAIPSGGVPIGGIDPMIPAAPTSNSTSTSSPDGSSTPSNGAGNGSSVAMTGAQSGCAVHPPNRSSSFATLMALGWCALLPLRRRRR
ncbi:MAG TPA: DUF2330 domain-containing protein [Polyangiaceae bacterium]|nr:DUF2330 domain-containing protein [Polyangiaceae bacterium]